jgi:hypothetical protein
METKPIEPVIRSTAWEGVLNGNIQQKEADMQANPQNAAYDQEVIDIDQKELALREQMDQDFLSGNSAGCNQDTEQFLLLEKTRPDGPLLETPEALNNELLSMMVADIRETDPHFAPMGTEQGAEALVSLQEIIDQIHA